MSKEELTEKVDVSEDEEEVTDSLSSQDNWTEKNIESEEPEEEDEEKFSIGSTMLARGSSKETWKEEEGFRSENLEESVDFDWEEGGFGTEEEEEEDTGFSYEAMGDEDMYGTGSGMDMYGNADSDMYGTGGAGDLYGTSSGANLYGGTAKGSNLYGVDKAPGTRGITYVGMDEGQKKKKTAGISYAVGTQGKKRKGKSSGLEGAVRRRRSKGVSIY